MSTLRILLAEIGYRKLNFAMSLVAVLLAVALLVAGPMLVEGYRQETEKELAALDDRVTESGRRLEQAERESAAEMALLKDETRKVMRDLGFNLLLVHRDTDIVQFLANRLPTIDMPEEYLDRLAKDRRLTLVTHLVGALRAKLPLEGREVFAVGYLPETPQSHMAHETPMGYAVKPGTVLLGHQLGKDRKPGDTIQLSGQTFQVAQVLPEQGSEDDSTVALHLSDAQKLLDKPGKVNLILALECRCAEDALPSIRKQIAAVLPETQVLRDTAKAVARARQRSMVAEKHQQIVRQHRQSLEERQQVLEETRSRREKMQGLMETLLGLVTPLVVLVSGLWVGLLAMANVRERRYEIGLLRALGKGAGTIWALFLGKALLVGLAGALVGCALGMGLARWLAASALGLPPESLPWLPELLVYGLLGAPLLSVVASYLPTLSALVQDPAVVLRESM